MKRKLNFSDKAGFTLVELIVVIAILAILGGTATVGYSAYVDKANESADRQMISDIEQALILGAYSKNYAPGSIVGAVGISKDSNAAAKTADVNKNGEEDDTDIDEMMIRAFGENWEDTLQLQGNLFTESDASNIKNAMQGVNDVYFASVPNSSFYGTDGATDDLAAKVDEIAGAFKGILGEKNGYVFGSFWNDDFRNKVTKEDLDITDSQTAANLTVMAAANAIAGSNANTQKVWIDSWSGIENVEVSAAESGYVAPLVMNYAKYVAFVSYVNDPANNVDPEDVRTVNNQYAALETAMAGLTNNTGDGGSYVTAFNEALKGFENKTFKTTDTESQLPAAFLTWQTSGQAKTDAEAFIASMAAVNALEGTYVNKDKANVLNQQNAFTNFDAASILDTMVNYASMSGLPEGDYVIILKIAPDGTPYCDPTLQEE